MKAICVDDDINTLACSVDRCRELAQMDNLALLCGHYEGIDERVIEEIVTDEFSIGDFVVTGGEMPAMLMIDAISRMIPGVRFHI